VRLGTRDVRAAGRGAGSIYAVSTVGSLVGTLLTGFVLVPAFETDHILVGAGALLVVLGGGSLARRKRPLAMVAFLAPLAGWSAPGPELPSGITLVDRAHSLYGLVEVLDDSNRGVRFLRIDHSIMGAHFLRDGSSGFAFVHLLEGARFLRPEAEDVLQIGVGSGASPMSLSARGFKVDVVDIDPAMITFAQRYFGFATRGETFVEDARTFLARTERRYDVVVHDTFTGGTTPEHLLSLEIFRRIHDVLRAGGVLELNMVGYHDGPRSEATLAVARTLGSVFPRVRVFRDSALSDHPDEPANLVFFASDGALDFTIPADAWFENEVCEANLRSFQRWEVLERVAEGPLVTDEHNPLARLQLPVAVEHYGAMNELLNAAVWRRY
jgi:spermidine synthase